MLRKKEDLNLQMVLFNFLRILLTEISQLSVANSTRRFYFYDIDVFRTSSWLWRYRHEYLRAWNIDFRMILDRISTLHLFADMHEDSWKYFSFRVS